MRSNPSLREASEINPLMFSSVTLVISAWKYFKCTEKQRGGVRMHICIVGMQIILYGTCILNLLQIMGVTYIRA